MFTDTDQSELSLVKYVIFKCMLTYCSIFWLIHSHQSEVILSLIVRLTVLLVSSGFMIGSEKRAMNIPDGTRAITSVTVSRTSSLREQVRPATRDDPSGNDNDGLVLNKRSLSNDKMSSDSMVPVFIYQRGSSLRHFGKSAFPISSPNSNNHHAFKIIKPIDTSPRASEVNLDPETTSAVKASSTRLKFKHRNTTSSQGGPLIPDHNLMIDPPKDSMTFTPRPPLVKRFSSDQEEPTSDIDANLSNKNIRFYQIHPPQPSAPRPPISPTRGGTSTSSKCMVTTTSLEKVAGDKPGDNVGDDDTSEMDDIPNSDCETPPFCNNPDETGIKDFKYRSSLRKGSDSPNQMEAPGRGSPSPTKTVKWNLNAEVKKIPRSRSLNGKHKSSKTRGYSSTLDRNGKTMEGTHSDHKLVESHETYISHCTRLIRKQVTLLEDLRHNKISVRHYKKSLADSLECQKKLIESLQNIYVAVALDEEKNNET